MQEKKEELKEVVTKASKLAGAGGFFIKFGIPIIFAVASFLVVILLFLGIVIAGGGAFSAMIELEEDIGVTFTWDEEKEYEGGKGGTYHLPEHLRGKFLYPAHVSRVSSGYGNRGEVKGAKGSGGFHAALDFTAGGTKPDILPIFPGKVIMAHRSPSFGNVVYIDHGSDGGGYMSIYAHLDNLYVKTGQEVDYNTPLGKMGTTGRSSGIHLHLEICKSNCYGKSRAGLTVNPAQVLTCNDEGIFAGAAVSGVDVRKCSKYREGIK